MISLSSLKSIMLDLIDYESHLWDSFLYGAADANFAGPGVTLRCPDTQ